MKYACDLMQVQMKLGHIVVALYPGGVSCFRGSCCVHRDSTYHGIKTFEMTNPLPVSLMYGIKDIKREVTATNLDRVSFENLLDNVKPDVFHVHTLMGLPLDYLRIVHERGIRIVYTSHDYFGLCPKVNFINQDGKICMRASAEKCSVCNAHARSATFLKLRNAKWVVPLKSLARRMKR